MSLTTTSVTSFVLFPFCLFLLAVTNGVVASCSRGGGVARAAGVLGSAGLFPWLGVLRVHLHDAGGMKLALTGIVLVKDNYALGSAHDVARIPKRIFQEESRAMFIPRTAEVYYCNLVDYITHPDYPTHTHTTIALLELSMEGLNQFPVPAACWPPAGYNTTRDLYAIGYTDENQVLEKFIHPVKHVETDLCREFYNRAALQEDDIEPVYLRCAHAAHNKQHCVWDTGLALASNTTGHWVLLGLGLHGPGCSAPARFVSLLEYFPWMETATAPSYRRTAFNIGFRAYSAPHDVPTHSVRRQGLSPPQHTKHEFAHYYSYGMVLHHPFYIQRIHGARIDILPARGHYKAKYGNCSVPGLVLVYQDWTHIYYIPAGNRQRGVANYHLTLYDTLMANYTCVSLRLHSHTGNAYLRYMSEIDDASMFPPTPSEIVRVYPLYELSRLVPRGDTDHMLPDPISSPARNISAYNINLFLQAVFYDSCKFQVAIFGVPCQHPVTSPTSTTTTTTTTPAAPTTDPYKGPNDRRLLMDDELEKVVLARVVASAARGGDTALLQAARHVLWTGIYWSLHNTM